MNELEEIFDDLIDFRSLDANAEGKEAFRAFQLRGHPAYVLLNPNGDVVWSGLGEQPLDNINKVLETALGEP